MDNLYSDVGINNDTSDGQHKSFQYDESILNRYDPKVRNQIKQYPNLIYRLQAALKGREFLAFNKNKRQAFISYENDPFKFLEENDLNVITHDSLQQSWINTEIAKWNNIIASLQKVHFCAICNEEDFSITYVCSTAKDSTFILSKIQEFLSERPTAFKITSHVREFIRHNKRYSHLKMVETSQGEIWIENISHSLFLALKEDIRNANCKSYLLDENQYGLLFEMENNILSNIENDFQVKGHACSINIPHVVEVNPQTKVSCMLEEESGNIFFDHLIILDHQKPPKDFILDCDRHRYKIWQTIPWDIPANQVVYAEICSEEFKLSDILECCLRKIYSNPFPVTVVGIMPSLKVIQKSEEFVNCLTLVVEYLQAEQVKIPYHHIMVIRNTETLEEFQRENENEKHNPLILNVIEGDLSNQTVDAVVNSTNIEMDLSKGEISKALLKKAGPLITKEFERQNPAGLGVSEVILTKGYGLPCSYVMHGVLPRPYKASVVSEFVSLCLDKAVQCKFSSIAFPALGTGNLRYPPNEVAKEMKESIETFERSHPHCGLKVYIVLFPGQPEIQKSFSDEFGNNSATLSTKPKEKFQNMPQSKTLRWILFVNYSNKPNNLELALESLQNQLTKVPIMIDSVRLDQMLFFTKIYELIPDIITQYSEEKKTVRLLVQKENLRRIKDLLTDTSKTLLTDKLQIKAKLTNKQVEILLQIVRQQYPFIKCQFFDNDHIFSFQGFLEENIKLAKDLLKSSLGSINWIDPIHESQSNLDRQESEEHLYASITEERNEFFQCFQIADDFFIKVYANDILNLHS